MLAAFAAAATAAPAEDSSVAPVARPPTQPTGYNFTARVVVRMSITWSERSDRADCTTWTTAEGSSVALAKDEILGAFRPITGGGQSFAGMIWATGTIDDTPGVSWSSRTLTEDSGVDWSANCAGTKPRAPRIPTNDCEETPNDERPLRGQLLLTSEVRKSFATLSQLRGSDASGAKALVAHAVPKRGWYRKCRISPLVRGDFPSSLAGKLEPADIAELRALKRGETSTFENVRGRIPCAPDQVRRQWERNQRCTAQISVIVDFKRTT